MPSRRAPMLLFAIESRTARLAQRTRVALTRYPTPVAQVERERAFLGAIADGRASVTVSTQDLERFAPDWASLLPQDPDTIAAVAALLLEKYALRCSDATRLTRALRLDDPDVATAFERQQHRLPGDAFAHDLPLVERVRWWQAGIVIRLESLPAAWTAFALTLTETIGVGILALPIAFAAAGPIAAAVMLVVFGLVNMLTLAGLVESITRTGTMRYTSAYFGRLVGEYFGRSGSLSVSVAILLLNAIGLAILIFGFGTSAASITGLPAVAWAAALALGIIIVLRRESLDATVASVLIVGGVNIAVLLALVALAFLAFDASNFSAGLAATDSDIAVLLGLVFGTAMMAFFGHTSAANAARVVLERDPSGRGLMRGNIAALLTALVLYLLFVIAVLGAVPADEMIGFGGTALTPLVAATGPLVASLGLIFVALAMGLSSLHMSLSLYNQVGERLPRPGTAATSRMQALLGSPRARTVAKAAPVVLLLIVVEAMLITDTGSFTESVNFVGVITLPFVAGLFPMMLLMASRRRGEYIPGRSLGILGHPAVATAIAAVFFGSLLMHALFIWDDPVRQGSALVAAVIFGLVVVVAIRDRAFARRVVAEVRVDSDRPPNAEVRALAAGRTAAIRLHWTAAGSKGEGVGSATVPSADQLSRIAFSIPPGSPSSLRVWIHHIDGEGESAAWPVDIVVEADSRRYALETDTRGRADQEIGAAGAEIEIEPRPGGVAYD